jgi:peroxiredoxin
MKRNFHVPSVATLAFAFLVLGASRLLIPSMRTAAYESSSNTQTRIAPDFALKSLDGRTVKLSDFRGKFVLLNFWATWCAPCRVEMPWLVELDKKYRPQGLVIVGVSIDDPGEDERVKQFIQERSVAYTILLGNQSVGDAYGGLRFLPETFFIDREGRIIKNTYGIRKQADLEEEIKNLLFGSRIR